MPFCQTFRVVPGQAHTANLGHFTLSRAADHRVGAGLGVSVAAEKRVPAKLRKLPGMGR